jgi:putative ABC transport system ATP-binding protein
MVHKVIIVKDGQILKDYKNDNIVSAAELEDL